VPRGLTWFVFALIAWLPLQTPIATALYQYATLPADLVRIVVLAKDVVVVAVIALLVVTFGRRTRWTWIDGLAAAYTAIVAIYSILPLLAPDRPSLNATAAGFRQYILPVELFALGRLAAVAGVRFGPALRASLIVAFVAALLTTALFVFVPVTFWETTLDLVRYIRDVQGLSYATSLRWTSVIMSYGTQGEISRAIGPFSHPVGTASFFVLPLALAFAGLCAALGRVRRWQLLWILSFALFAASIIFTISRGGWAASMVAILAIGLALRQVRLAAVSMAIFAAVVWFIPPFSLALHSAAAGTDGSAVLHQQAVQNGLQLVLQHPLGLGVASGDAPFASTFDQNHEEGTLLESTYLSLYVGTGPFGLCLFMAWIAGVMAVLWPGRRSLKVHWSQLAILAAFLGLAVASLTSATTLRFTTSGTFWMLVGLAVGHLPKARFDVLARASVRRALARRSPDGVIPSPRNPTLAASPAHWP
jgi:hypothetical protein